MHYLKCNKCGHFNEVNNENLIFCSNCSKKLENNYSDWSKRNYDKTFDDYKQLVCVTERNEPSKAKSISLNGKRIKSVIGFVVAIAVIAAVVFAVFYAIGQWGGEKLTELAKSSQKSLLDKALVEMANEFNKNCPIILDNDTRVDGMAVLPGNVLQYNYTLVNMVRDSVNIDGLKNYLEPNIVNYVKTSPDMKFLREHKTLLNYYYKDKVGVYVLTITIKPEQYQ